MSETTEKPAKLDKSVPPTKGGFKFAEEVRVPRDYQKEIDTPAGRPIRIVDKGEHLIPELLA